MGGQLHDRIHHIIVSALSHVTTFDGLIGKGRQVAHDIRVPGVAPPPARMAISVVTHATVPAPSLPIIEFRGSDRVWVALEARGPLHVEKPMGPGCRILGQAEDRCVSRSVVAFPEAGSIITAQVPMHIRRMICALCLFSTNLMAHVGVTFGRLLISVRNIPSPTGGYRSQQEPHPGFAKNSLRAGKRRLNVVSGGENLGLQLQVQGVDGQQFFCDTLELLATVDQLIVFDLMTVEGLCRQLQLWELFYGTRLRATNVRGLPTLCCGQTNVEVFMDAREIRSDRRWCGSLVIPGSPSVSLCNAPFSKNVAAPVNKGCSPLLILVASMIPLMELLGVWPGQRWSRLVELDWQRLAALPTLALWGSLTRVGWVRLARRRCAAPLDVGLAWSRMSTTLTWTSTGGDPFACVAALHGMGVGDHSLNRDTRRTLAQRELLCHLWRLVKDVDTETVFGCRPGC